MAKIDNYANVLNYRYVSKESNIDGKNMVHLKNTKFSFLDTIELNGIRDNLQNRSNVSDIYNDEQYPQGLCVTDEYIFVTSYSGVRSALGECKVYNRLTGEWLVTLGMDKSSHLGGIAFDGKNIWVCNSSKMAIERISYDFIHYAARHNKGEFVNVTNLVELYGVKNIPSGITFQNGVLYVVTHTKWTDSKMMSYVYDEMLDRLQVEFVYKIPSKVQGIAFDEAGCVYLSVSYGRKNSSYIKKYSSIYTMTRNVESFLEQIEMPPCSEGVSLYGNKLYVLFESAGKKYLEGTDGNGKSISPLNKILVIDLT